MPRLKKPSDVPLAKLRPQQRADLLDTIERKSTRRSFINRVSEKRIEDRQASSLTLSTKNSAPSYLDNTGNVPGHDRRGIGPHRILARKRKISVGYSSPVRVIFQKMRCH